MTEHNKWVCATCEWVGASEQLLKAKSPFDPEVEIVGCPECKSAETLYAACDEPGCDFLVSCGFLTPNGYRNTCGKHSRSSIVDGQALK